MHILETSARMPDTRFAKILRELGCSPSTPPAPHKAASLSQKVTLWPRVLSQCHRRMPHTFCPYQLRFRSLARCVFVTEFAVPLSSAAPQDMRTRQNRFCTFPSLILLVPSLARCDHVRPSLSSFRLEDETANVTDGRLARFNSSIVRVVQDGLEGVITRSLFGQLIRPFVASSHEAASLIQLGSLRFGQVRFTFRHGVNVGVRPQRLGNSPRFASTRQRAAFVPLHTISAHVPSP